MSASRLPVEADTARELGTWTGGGMAASDLVREYDWDGAVGPTLADMCALMTETDWHTLAEKFWEYYLARPELAGVAHEASAAWVERRLAGRSTMPN